MMLQCLTLRHCGDAYARKPGEVLHIAKIISISDHMTAIIACSASCARVLEAYHTHTCDICSLQNQDLNEHPNVTDRLCLLCVALAHLIVNSHQLTHTS
jgi:hypothetical protein